MIPNSANSAVKRMGLVSLEFKSEKLKAIVSV